MGLPKIDVFEKTKHWRSGHKKADIKGKEERKEWNGCLILCKNKRKQL